MSLSFFSSSQAFNTDAVDNALDEIMESTSGIVHEEKDDEKDDEEDEKERGRYKRAPVVPPPSSNPATPMKFPKGKGLQPNRVSDPNRFRLNTFDRFRSLKEQEVSELYSKLSRSKLTPQEIEARLNRSKKTRETNEENELQRRLRLHREKKQSAPYRTLRGKHTISNTPRFLHRRLS